VSRKLLCEIIEPRMEEILSLARQELMRAGMEDRIPSGIVLSALDINLFNIVERFQLLIRRIAEFGFDAVHWAFRYFLLGAVVVIPIWVIVRLAKRDPKA